jgi:hypothetical protein
LRSAAVVRECDCLSSCLADVLLKDDSNGKVDESFFQIEVFAIGALGLDFF